jgi:galactoside 2-L-fucosyltransferase 1/2
MVAWRDVWSVCAGKMVAVCVIAGVVVFVAFAAHVQHTSQAGAALASPALASPAPTQNAHLNNSSLLDKIRLKCPGPNCSGDFATYAERTMDMQGLKSNLSMSIEKMMRVEKYAEDESPREHKVMLELLQLLHPAASHQAVHSLLNITIHYPHILIAHKPFNQEDQAQFDDDSDIEWLVSHRSMDNPGHQRLLCGKVPSPTIRFGNLLFIYAAAFSLAKKTGRNLIMEDKFQAIKDVFKGAEFATLPRQSLGFYTFHLKQFAVYLKWPTLQADRDYCIEGFFQSWKYFYTFAPIIREQLQFTDDIVAQADDYLSQIRAQAAAAHCSSKDNVVVVGLHVRRSDMASKDLQAWGYSLPSVAFYQRAMLYFLARYHNHTVRFVLATDSPAWALHHLARFNRSVLHLPPRHQHHYAVDLAILARADHVILGAGTFGWWAGWLSRGHVVYYNAPVRKHSDLDAGFSAADYFPHHWLPME